MKKFVVIYREKLISSLTDELLVMHVNYLKKLHKSGNLQLCGPMSNNNGAVLILITNSQEEAIKIIESDPFIVEGYYQEFYLEEFIEANEANNWLMDGN